MSKKTVSYGVGFTTKGIAYVRHHIGDRLISDKVVVSRNEFNEKFWNPFRCSNYRNFWLFLSDNLSAKQMLDIVTDDKRQAVWITGILPKVKTSSLIIMPTSDYKRLDNLSAKDTYFVCYASKHAITSVNDVCLTLSLPKV